MAGNLRITGGKLLNRQFLVPKEADVNLVRPAADRVREAIFSSLGTMVKNADILDCFAGSGSYGFESLSRGANFAVFIEKNKQILATLKSNAVNLGLEKQCHFHCGNAIKEHCVTEWPCVKFDLIFVDPPYRLKLCELFWMKLPIKQEGLVIFRCQSEKTFIHPPNYIITREKKYGGTWVVFLRKHPSLSKQ